MKSRTFGWIQDSGDIKALKRVIKIFIRNSDVNKDLHDNKIPKYVPDRCDKDKMIKLLEQEEIEIPYDLLKGKGNTKKTQLSVEENMKMFGLSKDSAERMVQIKGRPNVACSGIAQACLEAQKAFKIYIPSCLPGEANIKKPYQSDWATEAFIKWGISLGLLSYDYDKDTCKITALGREYANSEDDSNEEKELLGNAYLSYPPIIRILSLLESKGPLTKFQIASQFGFIGQAGFTSIPQDYFIYCCNEFPHMKAKSNLEGTSDKYVRMICEWMSKLGWVKSSNKKHSCFYLCKNYVTELKTYEITELGKIKLKFANGYSKYPRIHKRVFCEMLSTRIADGNYTQTKRATLLKYLCTNYHTMEEILSYLKSKGFDELQSTIEDDISGFENIGLAVSRSNNKYKVLDTIDGLYIPKSVNKKDTIIELRDYVGSKLKNINHKYLVLIDLAYSDATNKSDKNSDAREFEIETANLFTKELGFKGERLGNSDKPDIIISYGNKGTIIDNKSYKDGFNVDRHCADEISRYIEQNQERHEGFPANEWWKKFGDDVNEFTFLFITSYLKGNFKKNLEYISTMRKINGGAISVDNLLYLAEEIKSKNMTHDEFFNLFENDEIKVII